MVKPKKDREFPQWYHRLTRFPFKRRPWDTNEDDIHASDFDEDISDLECKSSECEEEHYYREDRVGRSRKKSEADFSNELHELREFRNHDLKERRYQEERNKKDSLSRESIGVKKAANACKALRAPLGKKRKNPKSTDSINIAGGFLLYSTDYVEHCWPEYSDFGGTVYIDFYYVDEKDNSYPGENKSHMYLRRQCVWNIKPFTPPMYASLDRYRLQNEDGDDIMFQLISKDYCKLSVSRKLVLMYSDIRPSENTPEFFEFVGIHRDSEKGRDLKRRGNCGGASVTHRLVRPSLS